MQVYLDYRCTQFSFYSYTITQLQNFYGMDMDTWTEMILKQPTDQPSIPAHVVKIFRKNLSVK